MSPQHASELEIIAPVSGAQSEILSKDALNFLARLTAEFDPRRQELLERRRVRQREIDAGRFPDFLSATASIREKEWTVAPIPAISKTVASKSPDRWIAKW